MDVLSTFKKNLNLLSSAVDTYELQSKGVDPDANDVLDYKAGRAKYSKTSVRNSINMLKNSAWDLVELRKADKDNGPAIMDILSRVSRLSDGQGSDELRKNVAGLVELSNSLSAPLAVGKTGLTFDIPTLPDEITPDVIADLNEIRKCFDAESYRGCIILCGRVLESALNRKYYEASGADLLETSPGLGLGKIIAKLSEKGVKFDPGLTQQIHLINQVRIFSVHKKSDAFYPSKGQAQAMILYTMDVLKKLFA